MLATPLTPLTPILPGTLLAEDDYTPVTRIVLEDEAAQVLRNAYASGLIVTFTDTAGDPHFSICDGGGVNYGRYHYPQPR